GLPGGRAGTGRETGVGIWFAPALFRPLSPTDGPSWPAPTVPLSSRSTLMCGIVGYVGAREAAPLLVEGLRRLEYRGYDSAGVATLCNGSFSVLRSPGKLSNLLARLGGSAARGTTGIGHTRWATHGRPTEANAHPHTDCTGRVVV